MNIHSGQATKKFILESLGLLVVLMAIVGLGGFLSMMACEFFSWAKIPLISSKIRLPLAPLVDMAVDKQGHVICYGSSFKRLQIFDKKGNFLRGWFIKNPHAGALLRTDPNGLIHFINDLVYLFDLEGKILKETKEPGLYRRLYSTRTLYEYCEDAEGNSYNTEGGIFGTIKVIKVEPSGQEHILIKDPLYLRFIGNWFVTILLVLPFGLMIGISEHKKRHALKSKTIKQQDPTES